MSIYRNETDYRRQAQRVYLSRPIMRYHGGKWRLAPWIIKHFPKHRVYVEPFGGGASVLLRKERVYAEVYNDLDGEIVNLFRVARDHGEELERMLRLTPYAREELYLSNEPSQDQLEQARRTVARSFMRFGYQRVTKASFRSDTKRKGGTPARNWATFPDAFRAIVERLQGVVIENREAERVMRAHDSPETLHYVDPPYVQCTRGQHKYRYDMDAAGHAELCRTLRELKGFVVLSGYPNSIYSDQLGDWLKVDRRAFADGARRRTECLWLSPSTVQKLKEEKGEV